MRAEEYRAIAAEALKSAKSSTLTHVRDKFLRSAEVWIEMAKLDELKAQSIGVAR